MLLILLVWLHEEDLRPEVTGVEVTLWKQDTKLRFAAREDVERPVEDIAKDSREASEWSSLLRCEQRLDLDWRCWGVSERT